MAKYKFRTLDSEGKQATGEAKASSSEAIVAELRGRGLTVLEVLEVEERSAAQVQAMSNKVLARVGISSRDLMIFTRQLATTLQAGVPLLRILATMRKRSRSKGLIALLESLSANLQKGMRFSDALATHKRIFSDTYVNMVRVGEASGNLPEVVQRLALMIEKDVAIQRKVKSAASYPLFIMIFTGLLTYGLLTFLLPMFTPMFEGAGINIDQDFPLTAFLVKASNAARDPVGMAGFVGGLVFLVFLFRSAMQTSAGRYTRDVLLYNLPLFSKLVQESAAARFSRTFGLLLQSGVPLLQALSLVGDAAGNMVITRSLEKVARQVSEGGKLSEKLDEARVFPDLMVQMASIGEEAGSLSDMFGHVADYFEEEVDATVTSLTAILEPLMMVCVGGLVCVFVMGLLLPILSLSTKIGGN